ncbi:MAG TPA: hypothetical protein VF230_00055 [Acidimicrobiales bacterium]
MLAVVATALVAAAETTEHEVKGLEGKDLAIAIGVIAAAVFVVVLAGLGYFSPGSGGSGESGSE